MLRQSWEEMLRLRSNRPYIKWLQKDNRTYVCLLLVLDDSVNALVYTTIDDVPDAVVDSQSFPSPVRRHLGEITGWLEDAGYFQDDAAGERYLEYYSRLRLTP